MAAQNATQGEPRTFPNSKTGDRLAGVVRTGGAKATGRGQERRNEFLVSANEPDEEGFHLGKAIAVELVKTVDAIERAYAGSILHQSAPHDG